MILTKFPEYNFRSHSTHEKFPPSKGQASTCYCPATRKFTRRSKINHIKKSTWSTNSQGHCKCWANYHPHQQSDASLSCRNSEPKQYPPVAGKVQVTQLCGMAGMIFVTSVVLKQDSSLSLPACNYRTPKFHFPNGHKQHNKDRGKINIIRLKPSNYSAIVTLRYLKRCTP